MTADDQALRDQYLAAIEHEIALARARLSSAKSRLEDDPPRRFEALTAVVDVTLDWLEGERDRLRAGGEFDEAEASRFLDAAR